MSTPNNLDQLVEAHLVSVTVPERSLLKLRFHRPAGDTWVLTAMNVHCLLVAEMRLQNIVDRVEVYNNLLDIPDEVCYRLFALIEGRAGTKADLLEQAFRSRLRSLVESKVHYLELEAVYGAEVFLLAQSISLQEEQTGESV